MKTEKLIDVLSTNHEPVRRGEGGKALASALIIGGVAALCLMLATLGLRPNLTDRAHLGFLALKLLFTVSLVVVGAALLGRAMRPGRDGRRLPVLIFAPFVAIILAGLGAIALAPPSTVGGMLLGAGWAACLVCIPLFAVIPFAALIWALRKAAPTNLGRAGALAGLVAGAIGAAAYAFHCPDDSLPFIAIWYGAPIALLAFVGSKLGPRFLRW